MNPTIEQLNILREHISKTIENNRGSEPKDIAKIIVQDVSWFFYEPTENEIKG